MSRWQRERRQQAVIVTVFTAVLLSAVGLVAWAASERYYEENLAPAVSIDGRIIPMREFQRQLDLELVRFYQEYGVPPGFENDPELLQQKAQYETLALERLIEQRILDAEAKEAGYEPAADEVETQYAVEFGEYRVRHILIEVPADAEDKELAELNAAAKARFVLNELRAAPMDQDLWNKLAAEHSNDPGSQFSGGELGFAPSGQYVSEFADALRTLEIGQVSDLVKTQFGYHIIQVQEKREPSENEIVQRYLSSGYTEIDLRERARYDALKKEFERRAKAASVTSPTEQLHLAAILVHIPLPTAESFDAFSAALQKQTDVRNALAAGTDFAEIAKQYSDDTESKEKGGDIGWVARGMIVEPAAEERVFGTEPGNVADPITLGATQWIVYKVLEKEAARDLDEDQTTRISNSAYQYWLEREKQEHGVDKHILEF
jgi:parvulin-like peptidyl-prolyl isomerase